MIVELGLAAIWCGFGLALGVDGVRSIIRGLRGPEKPKALPQPYRSPPSVFDDPAWIGALRSGRPCNECRLDDDCVLSSRGDSWCLHCAEAVVLAQHTGTLGGPALRPRPNPPTGAGDGSPSKVYGRRLYGLHQHADACRCRRCIVRMWTDVEG